ncbi:bifunctional metallophosphatase/5'-nucleotidase [Acidobacteriota bacterium]
MRSIPVLCGAVLIAFPVLVLILAGGCDIQARPENIHLVILHVNDTHGHLYPHDFNKEWNVGGAARMATLINGVRNENPEQTLVLHAGDIFSRGGPLTVYSGGGVDMLALDAMGFDAMVPGNGEFYTGIDNLMRHVAAVDISIILANVYFMDSGDRLLPPFVIKEASGIKVGILGLGFFYENHPASWHLRKEHPEEAALKYVPVLRAETDLVIALTHLGHDVDKAINFYLKSAPDKRISIQIEDITGQHKRDLVVPGKAGINQARWDMRFPPQADKVSAFKARLVSVLEEMETLVSTVDEKDQLQELQTQLGQAETGRALNSIHRQFTRNFAVYSEGRDLFGQALSDRDAAPGVYRVTLKMGAAIEIGQIRIRNDPILE